MLSTEPVLRKAAVDRGLRFSTEQYGCRQRDNMIFDALGKEKTKVLTFTNAADFLKSQRNICLFSYREL